MTTYRAAVITVSDRCYRKEVEDRSGPALIEALESIGVTVTEKHIVPDEHNMIKAVLQKMMQSDLDAVFTTGGTGFGPRDVTPEVTREIIERPAPGIAELLRQAGASQTPLTWLSRGEAGICGNKLIVNLPGSTKAMSHSIQTLKPLLFHAIDLIHGKQPH